MPIRAGGILFYQPCQFCEAEYCPERSRRECFLKCNGRRCNENRSALAYKPVLDTIQLALRQAQGTLGINRTDNAYSMGHTFIHSYLDNGSLAVLESTRDDKA